ncbi:MAG: hypothetical protein V5B32_07975 [Candidatus Accumulibacter sp. UW26]|jgi:hypothetical protein
MSAVLARPSVTMKIPDLQTGFQILSRLPLANIEQSRRELDHFLDSLLRSPPPGAVYLQLLEQIRISFCFIQEELARRYTGKPLPLGEVDEEDFQDVVASWLKVARAYGHCAKLQEPGDSPADIEQLALILHRCIYYTGMGIFEHYRARQALPAGLWLNLHGYYASAEEWGLATIPVPDSLDSLGRKTHCTAAFASLLLTDLAGPYSLSVSQLAMVWRWANHWAPLVSIQPLLADQPLPPFVVDLMQDYGLRTSNECPHPENLRRIDTSRLSMQMNQTRQQLQLRIPPMQLGLGDDASPAQCHHLLSRLYRPWSMLRAVRQFRRHRAAGTSKVCSGFEGIHFQISRTEFQQPDNAHAYSRQDFDRLFAFRHTLDPTQMLEVRQIQLGLGADTWQVIDQCANGFRLLRTLAGRRIEPGQLVSICPHDGKSYLLAQVAWLMQEQSGGLIAGIAALPGKPLAVAARPLVRETGDEGRYHRAFILPAVPAIAAEQSLILPAGWFRAERILEVFGDRLMHVKLQRRMSEGQDFQRVTFTVV